MLSENLFIIIFHYLFVYLLLLVAAEKKCTDTAIEWSQTYATLEMDIEKWKLAYKQEKLKSDHFKEQLSKTEREMYSILQRKYEVIRGPGNSNKKSTNSSSAGLAHGFTSQSDLTSENHQIAAQVWYGIY